MSKYNENAFINDIRLLALNMAYKSKITYNNSILSVVPILYTLYKDHLVFDVDKPEWCNRDRLVLSNGNASSALYATLYTALGKYKQEDLEEYGSYKSNLSVYPSYDLDKSIEVTTTNSGEGLSMAIGMAIAEKNLESLYNKKKITLFNYNIYALCNYRDLTSASGLGSASVCSKYNLDNLIILYDAINREDNNKIMDMYLSMDFNVILVKNSSKLSEVSKALDSANKNRRPTLIIFESNEDKNSAYEIGNKILGSIKEEDMKQLTDILTVEDKKYNFEEAIKLYRQEIKERNVDNYSLWYQDYEEFAKTYNPDDLEKFNDYINNENITLDLEKVIDMDKLFTDKSLLDINYQIMNVISTFIPYFMGISLGDAVLTKAYLKGKGNYEEDNYTGRNIDLDNMISSSGGIMNGMALTNMLVFTGTTLSNLDKMIPSIKTSAIMNLPVTYIFTHDTFLNKQNGIINKPINELTILRSIPNLNVYRPADYKELIGVWDLTLKSKKPTAIILSNNKPESFKFTSIDEVKYGGYVISEVKNKLDLILIASGSELSLAMRLKKELIKNYIESRIVSMPNIDLFLKQDEEYRRQVLPRGYKKIYIEFSNDTSPLKLVSKTDEIINIHDYIKDGNESDILTDMELDITSLVIKIKDSI